MHIERNNVVKLNFKENGSVTDLAGLSHKYYFLVLPQIWKINFTLCSLKKELHGFMCLSVIFLFSKRKLCGYPLFMLMFTAFFNQPVFH